MDALAIALHIGVWILMAWPLAAFLKGVIRESL